MRIKTLYSVNVFKKIIFSCKNVCFTQTQVLSTLYGGSRIWITLYTCYAASDSDFFLSILVFHFRQLDQKSKNTQFCKFNFVDFLGIIKKDQKPCLEKIQWRHYIMRNASDDVSRVIRFDMDVPRAVVWFLIWLAASVA